MEDFDTTQCPNTVQMDGNPVAYTGTNISPVLPVTRRAQ